MKLTSIILLWPSGLKRDICYTAAKSAIDEITLRIKPKFALIFLLVCIMAIYGNHFRNGFHFDDSHTIIDNPSIRSLRNVPHFFTDATLFSVLPANQTYRPIVSTSLAMDYSLGNGYVPFWFHVTTFLLFLALVVLIYVLYKMLLDKIQPSPANAWPALLGAAWFGLHPAMAETVNYIIQRGDLYCTLGCVAALVIFMRWPAKRRYGLYLLPLMLALLSKPPAAVFPVLLLLYVFFFEGDGMDTAARWGKSALAAVPCMVVTGIGLWLQTSMTPKTFLPSLISPWDYRLTQAFVWLRYIGALFLPLRLNADTDLEAFHGINGEAVAGLVFVAVLAGMIWFASRRRETYPIAFGLLWFVITQLPTSLYPLSEVENDHRMFFSFVGLILAVVWAGTLAVRRWIPAEQQVRLKPVAAALAAVVLSGYAYGTVRRNVVWRDEESLWRDDVEKSPHNGRGLMNYGLTQMNLGRYAVALDYFQRALRYTPNYPTLEINLGIVNGAMAAQGDVARRAEAERHFLRAVALAPNDDTTHAYYGRWLNEQGRFAEAITQEQIAVALNPAREMQREVLNAAYSEAGDAAANSNAAQWINLSLTQYRQGEYAESIVSAQKALALDANSAAAWNNIGADDAGLHRWDEAIHADLEALKLNPQLQIARNNLAWAQAQKKLGVH